MGQYEYKEINKAAKAETWLKKQADGIKKHDPSISICEANIIFREPFEIEGEKYFNGFVSVYFKVEGRIPSFVFSGDEEMYWSNLKQFAKKQFNVQIDPTKETFRASFEFEEASEAELYALTDAKKKTISGAVAQIFAFAAWIQACASRYRVLVADPHKANLETFFKQSTGE